jgi:hypothetical protein
LTHLDQFSAYVIRVTQGGGNGGELEVIGPVLLEPLLDPDEIVNAGQSLAEAATSLNNFQLAFIADATSGADAAILDSDLIEIAARAMGLAQIAATLADNMTAQGDYSDDSGQPDLYYAVARLGYALVIEAQNLRDGLPTGNITPAAAAKTIAEYGTALWNPGPSPFGHPFRAYLDDPSVLDGLQSISPADAAALLGQLGGGATLASWLAVSSDTVTRTINFGPPEPGTVIADLNDPELLAFMTIAAGQIDGEDARRVAATQLGLLPGQQLFDPSGEEPTEIEVSFHEAGAIVGNDAIAAGVLSSFLGGKASALFSGTAGLQTASASTAANGVGAAEISFNGANQPSVVTTLPVTETPQAPPVTLNLTFSHAGGPRSVASFIELWDVNIHVSWQASANFRLVCTGGLYGGWSNILITDREGEATKLANWPPGEWRATCLARSPLLGRFLGQSMVLIKVGGGDDDADGISNLNDNCPNTFTNPFALNKYVEEHPGAPYTRPDKVGSDGCPEGEEPDFDQDGLLDGRDNCPKVANANQLDFDNDGLGDACDVDDDGDSVHDAGDACPETVGAHIRAGCSQFQLDQIDPDGDERCSNAQVCPGGDDNCPEAFNPNQEDSDGDGDGDACDDSQPDADGDSVPDDADICPSTPSGVTVDPANGCPTPITTFTSFTEVIVTGEEPESFATQANFTVNFATKAVTGAMGGTGTGDIEWFCYNLDDPSERYETIFVTYSWTYALGFSGTGIVDPNTSEFSFTAQIAPVVNAVATNPANPQYTHEECTHIDIPTTATFFGEGTVSGRVMPGGAASFETSWIDNEGAEVEGNWP